MRRDVAKVLDTAKADVVRLVKDKAGHLIAKPSDVRAVFNEKAFAEALAKALRPTMTGTAELVANETKRTLGHLNPSKAEPAFLDDVVSFVLRRGGERVVEMTNTTRDAITSAIKDVVSAGAQQGLGPSEIADRLTDTVGSLSTWSPERAETIARTESMFAYNDAAITSYREYGVDRVEAIDGDEDSECANRNGQTFTLDEALGIADHPNGTLDWLPVIKAVLEPEPESEMVLAVKALTEVAMRPHPQPIVNVYPADVNVTTPDVHVTSPDIHVHPAAVNVTVPPAKPTTKRVERDDDGRITGITED